MAALSLLWNVPGGGDASRLYFGTDTHCMGLLLGAALAAVWRPGALPKTLPPARRAALTGVGVAGLVIVLASFVFMTDTGSFLYRGGFLVVAGAAVVAIAVTTHPAALLGPALAIAPLRYIGTRSYGLYLYHWPIFAVTRPNLDLPFGGIAAFAVSMGLTFAVAELSYRYLETPIRSGAWSRTWHRWIDEGVAARRFASIGAGTAASVIIIAWLVAVIPAPNAADVLGGATSVGAGQLSNAPAAASPSQTPVAPGPVALTDPVTAIGDSVMVGAAKGLQEVLPAASIDAEIKRQPEDILARVTERKSAGQLADAVVIHAGTNGLIKEDDLRALLTELSDRKRVVLVTTHVPRSWQEGSNAAIATVAPAFPNVRVADWAMASAEHGDYFVYDGVHLEDAGILAYRDIIAQALQAP